METSFGNHTGKIDRYRNFWNRTNSDRALVGFTKIGWFPWDDFAVSQEIMKYRYLEPQMIAAPLVVNDHIRGIQEGDQIEDDLIRGISPMQVAVPFLPGIVGSNLRILPGNVLGEELSLSWDQAMGKTLDSNNEWLISHLALLDSLVDLASGRFPVSHSAEIGPSDLHAALRGHYHSIMDLIEEPEKSAELLSRMGEIFVSFAEEAWRHIPLFHGGYFDAQYSLWAPGSIVRMQEDASAVYSPELYRKLLQPVDKIIADKFEYSFIHLHTTSLFLLDAFLEIESIRCFEINKEDSGPPLDEMIPYYRQVQRAGRPLLIRGSFEPDELRLLSDKLDPEGLFFLIMVKDDREIERLRPALR